jgi:hypothetical protein
MSTRSPSLASACAFSTARLALVVASVLVCASCAGSLEDIARFAPPMPDAGQGGGEDAGELDAGMDAGESDAGTSDAGPDAGPHDAGTDAGTCNALTTIITPSCATAFCHSNGTTGSGMQAGLDLQSAGLPGRLIGDSATGGPGQIINAQSPDSSILYTKTLKPPPYGSQMPLGKPLLTPAQEACLRSWIHAAVGAP